MAADGCGMTKASRKHHYLPRHYLRGFVDGAGTFFVYDKLRGKIFQSNPDAAFFENDLNTVTLPGGSPSDFLEGLYTEMESRAWNSLDSIRQSTPDAPIALQDKMDLMFFLSLLHWRLPSNAASAERLSQRFFGPANELGFLKIESTTGTAVPGDIIASIRTSPAWMKTAKAILPFAPFFAGDSWHADLASWRFFYPADESSRFVVADNPIVARGHDDHDPVACLKDFIFPVSGRILLVSRGEGMGKILPPEFTIQYGTAIIERARRFVACHDRSFLSALVNDHELHVRFGKTGRIVPELFEMLGRTDEGRATGADTEP